MFLNQFFREKSSQLNSSHFFSILFCSVLSFYSLSTNYYVNDNSLTGDVFTSQVGNNTMDGLTSTTPKSTLTNLMATYGAVFTSGDTIFIDAGTYTTDIYIDLPGITPGITYFGAGIDQTIFDNQFAGNATNYFMWINESNTTLTNMTITGYENNGTQAPGHSAQALTIGDGISPITNVIIENVSFHNNGASGGNPAIVILEDAQVTLRGGGSFCNTAGSAYTGGVELYGDNNELNIENYIIADNYALFTPGGGLRIEGGDNSYVNVTNSRISNNVSNEGAGIFQINGTLKMIDCIIDGNYTINGSTHYGGAYRVGSGNSSFSKCIFSNNTGSNGLRGGAISARYLNSGAFSSNALINIQLDSCVFENNSPGTRGKDIYAANGFYNPCFVTAIDCQFLTGGNYNLYSDGSSPASSINATYFGSLPTKSGNNVSRTLSSNTLYTPTPAPPTLTGGCSSPVILPIELISFSGVCRQSDNLIQWATGSENNNSFFNVEKLNEHTSKFETIGQVDGVGYSTTSNYYEFIDENRLNNDAYYRLTQFDFDGKQTSSHIINVRANCNFESLNCFYQANSNAFQISFEQNSSSNLVFQLYSSAGRIIQTNRFSVEKDMTNKTIYLEKELPKGVYLISIQGMDSGVMTKKIVIFE